MLSEKRVCDPLNRKAVAGIHQAGFLHPDLKPANIQLRWRHAGCAHDGAVDAGATRRRPAAGRAAHVPGAGRAGAKRRPSMGAAAAPYLAPAPPLPLADLQQPAAAPAHGLLRARLRLAACRALPERRGDARSLGAGGRGGALLT